ncbi:MAG: hypothetical protein GTO29_13475 [Candidatus Latescibacteria bacterium]|nr:hypothetical protein [Candidatus Latescibacterota bacterium]NIO57262.1 hypothetical protein [Candidatus Latescibacterota bacterium]
MNKKLLFLTIPVLVIAFIGVAWACYFQDFTPGANCEGWQVSGSIYLDGTYSFDLFYEVDLIQNSTIVASFTGSIPISGSTGLHPFAISQPWGMELCGDYVAEGLFYFNLYGYNYRQFSVPFNCPCDGNGGCGTPGFWKNRPDEWPVDELTLGGVLYNKAQLMAIFDMPTRGDITIILAQHLIAAKFNLLTGGDGSIIGDIAAADAYLASYPIGSKPNGLIKTEGGNIKDELVDYNETCPDGPLSAPSFLRTSGTPEEGKTWGAIKQLYK